MRMTRATCVPAKNEFIRPAGRLRVNGSSVSSRKKRGHTLEEEETGQLDVRQTDSATEFGPRAKCRSESVKALRVLICDNRTL